jgi:undecaprenyl-diphosphatase
MGNWASLIAGFIVAFLVVLIIMKKFVDYLKQKPLKVFAIYRVAAGILLAVLVLTKIITLS